MEMTILSYIFDSRGCLLRYLAECLLFACLLIAVQGVIFVALPRNPFSYHRSLSSKISVLREVTGRKIVCVGGSSLAFGFDSECVQAKIGLPVVNTGHHAGLGLSFMLRLVNDYLNVGDIVILSPEYELFEQIKWNGSKVLVDAFFEDSSLVRYAGKEHIIRIATEISEVYGGRLQHIMRYNGKIIFRRNDIYNESSCNANGDVVSHIGRNRPRGEKSGYDLPMKQFEGSEAFDLFCEVVKSWKDRGVIVVLLPPSEALSKFKQNKLYAESLFVKIIDETGCLSLVSVKDSFFEDRLFFDTYYHMTGEGRRLRMQQLLKTLPLIIL